MKHTRQRLVIMILSAAMIVCFIPALSFATEQTSDKEAVRGTGHVPSDVEVYHVPDSEAIGSGDMSMEEYLYLPEKYDPRDKGWFKGIRVKDQRDTNLCWAFSASTAAQISYAKENKDKGTKAAGAELSPGHLGYFFFNRVNDPLGNTAGDKNLSDDWVSEGGTGSSTMLHMSTWSGLCSEEEAPFTNVEDEEGHVIHENNYDDDLAYYNELIEENSYLMDGSNRRVKRDDIKKMIYEHGAAVISAYFGMYDTEEEKYRLDWRDYFSDSSYKYYYNPDISDYGTSYFRNNHEMVVVGWDDTVKAECFSSYKHKRSSNPEDPYGRIGDKDANPGEGNDGAWIVQNSWGTDWGDGGYFYLSYYGAGVNNDDITAFDMASFDDYDYNFQYDGNVNSSKYVLSKNEQVANVFENTTEGEFSDGLISLGAISFTEYNDGPTAYHVDVYTCLSSKTDPTSGYKTASMDVFTDTAGFKTFQLEEPVGIAKGNRFSIVITTKNVKTFFGLETDGYSEEASAEKGQSLQKDGGKWADVADEEKCYNLRIKGLAYEGFCLHEDTTCVKTVKPTKSTVGRKYYKCDKCGLITDTVIPMLDPVPNPTKITKLVKGKECLTVKWAKSSEVIRDKHINGYQIRYSRKPSMKNSKTVTVKGWKTTSKRITKLKAKKKYYVQVRTWYKDSKGKNWYSSWSAKKSIKTKK